MQPPFLILRCAAKRRLEGPDAIQRSILDPRGSRLASLTPHHEGVSEKPESALVTATIPQERLRSLIRRHETVAAMLASGQSGGGDYVRLSREFAELDPVAEKARALGEAERELAEAEALLADPGTERDMR